MADDGLKNPLGFSPESWHDRGAIPDRKAGGVTQSNAMARTTWASWQQLAQQTCPSGRLTIESLFGALPREGAQHWISF